ncbi:MAG: NAD(P)-dependent oxidoreductase [Anaerolineales bacterium]|uniref:NAD(P)-dependent oxidoreductase n=1 Tax=Candidatus Desulfolinea nitratireducens TaxID=2841698 RepID=A0A8J6NMT1_9CHLR|nr:NAD(P)-dependent oxidoreductase [Candidatus Desulfolinea nitratireducens]MBL6959515.1 NAD(P)-dependent oxidoreductase [Anaerolineales bacterium]
MDKPNHIVITGGAGYIGSLLTSELLRLGYRVTVLDALLFGGESLVANLAHPEFRFVKADVTQPRALLDALRDQPQADALVHLAGIVGFPACQAIGREAAWRYNVEAVESVYEQSAGLGVERFVFSSTYSNYGLAKDGAPVNETTPLNPKSLYAETKVAAEEFLLAQNDIAPLIFRFATLYGISPRTRFDLIVNQFVLEAFTKRELIIYQRGYSRSFIHVRDIIRGIILGLEAPLEKISGQVYNLGTNEGNLTKDEIVGLVLKRLPETIVTYKDLTFGGDMRDITVSFEKIKREFGFEATLTPDDGVREVLFALQSGLIKKPQDGRYRNARFIVQ